jgi:hypothetical protein
MWVIYTVMSFFLLALLLPACLALVPTWRRVRPARHVACPVSGEHAVVTMDPWYAVRMHALGNYELRVRECSRWSERSHCDQECRVQIDATRG